MQTVACKFEISYVPLSPNALHGRHWSARYKERDCCAALIFAAIGRRRERPHTKVQVTIQMYRKRAMDRDNAWGSTKVIFDALKRLDWCRDDSEEWLEQVVKPVIVDKRPRTAITIEPAP